MTYSHPLSPSPNPCMHTLFLFLLIIGSHPASSHHLSPSSHVKPLYLAPSLVCSSSFRVFPCCHSFCHEFFLKSSPAFPCMDFPLDGMASPLHLPGLCDPMALLLHSLVWSCVLYRPSLCPRGKVIHDSFTGLGENDGAHLLGGLHHLLQ